MDSRAPATTLCLHKETRISLEASPATSTIQLQLPSTNAFGRSTRVTRKVTHATPVNQNEEEYRRRNLANASSIFFRDLSRYPRAILWRCLDRNTVLELRSVDSSKAQNEKREASLIIRLDFPNAIRTGGIALADSADDGSVNVFVLTKGNDLYTFTLNSNFFCQASASEDDLDRWCKTFRPSSLTISNAHKLVASSSRELLVSLGDGRLARLTRKKGEDGSQWTEAAYNDGQWGSSLRGLIRWQGNNSVRYEGQSLDQSTAVAACTSPDLQHILTVGLNHTLRAWNISTGKQTMSKDLLNIPREPQDVAKIMLDPGIATPLQIFDSHSSGGYKYFGVTFSPLSSGLFKFWGFRDADHEETGVRDLFPDDTLRLPDPDDQISWTLRDFKLRASPDTAEVDMWILLRLNMKYQLFYRKFPELQNIGEDWEFGWTKVSIDSPHYEPLNQPPITISDLDCEDVGNKWLDYLLTPERVPSAVLESALVTYAQTRDISISKSSKQPLKEKLTRVVASNVRFQQPHPSQNPLAYDIVPYDAIAKFRQSVSTEWTNFWNIVTDIQKSRWEPLSLNLDKQSDIPWIVMTDGCSAVRHCSEVEVLAENRPKDLFGNPRTLMASVESDGNSAARYQSDELSKLLEAASAFRASFSEDLRLACENQLLEELWTGSSHSVPDRIQLFYDQCKFSTEIRDGQYDQLVRSLSELGGFDGLTTESFLAIIESMAASQSTPSGLISTKFGLKTLVRGAQDMIALHSRVLCDLLFLAVFVEVEVDPDEYPMEAFNAVPIFITLLQRLQYVQLTHWLASNTRLDPDSVKTTADSKSDPKSSTEPAEVSTVLENLFARDIQLQSYKSQSQSSAFMHTIRDVLTWVSGNNELSLDNVLVSIQCDLLKNGNVELATSFQMYQPSTAWASYIRGRLCLLRHEFTEAALYFRKAAFTLSRPKPPSSEYALQSRSLLDPVSASFLASGLPNYYTHIADLFSPLRIHTQTATFTSLALQHAPPPPQRTDLLSRLFSASLATTDYPTAYSALTRYTDRALQRSALSSLVSEMASHDAVDLLLRFPFPTLQKDVDAWLVDRARAEAQSAPRPGTLPYFKILYAWRLRQGDYRGAAAVLVERLEWKRAGGGKRGKLGAKGEAEKALDEYLVGINALALVGGEEEGWVFVDGEEGRRKVVRLADLRERYGREMDRVGMLELGRFGILEEEDVDMEG